MQFLENEAVISSALNTSQNFVQYGILNIIYGIRKIVGLNRFLVGSQLKFVPPIKMLRKGLFAG